MSTYASRQDVENYIEGWVTDDPFALERLIQRAENDIDILVLRRRSELPPTQVISIIGATGGTYTLGWVDYNGVVNQTVLSNNATADQIGAAIQAFTSVGVGNVAVLGTNPFTVMWAPDWTRSHYLGQAAPALDYQIPKITINTAGLQGIASATVVQVAGRKVDPLLDIDENQALALSNATCAQVEYRNAMGPGFFVKPQYSSVKGPDYATQGRLPLIAPQAKRELSQVGLIQVSGRALAGQGRRGVARGWPNY